MFRRSGAPFLIHGFVRPGYEEVETEFRKNFSERGEIGAACAIFLHGEMVVDLWGGVRDHRTDQPWEKNTLVLMFSATKGMAAMCLAIAHSRRWLHYGEKVATYWPEFAQQGKANVTVRQLLSHQAGLCVIDEPLDLEKLAHLDAVADAIARQKPAWEPGTRFGYHAISLGFYVGELLRRVDPLHRSLGAFFQDEIARPLGLEFYIGLPPDVSPSRLAFIKPIRPVQLLHQINKLPRPLVLAFLQRKSLTARAFGNPNIKTEDYNKRLVQELEIPASNGIGQVRCLAKAYSVLATGGTELNLRRRTLQALYEPAVPILPGLLDEVLKVESAYSLGYLKPSPHFDFGCSHHAFGASGAGGAFAFADPDVQVGYAYAPNKMDVTLRNDPRERALRHAFYRCLESKRR